MSRARKLSCLAVLLAFLFPFTHRAAAQEAQETQEEETRKVILIDIEGNVRVNRALIRDNLKTRVGEVYSRADETDDIKMIFERFGLSAVFILVEVPGGLRVVIHLDEGLRIMEYAIRGVKDSEKEDLEELLGLDPGTFPNQYLLRSNVQKIRDHFREKGYYFAEVNTMQEPVEGGVRLVFEVFKGEDVSVEKIHFTGLVEVEEGDLRSVMSLGEPTVWNFKWLFPDKLKEADLKKDIFGLNQYLKQEGYLDARVTLDRLDFNDDFDEVEIHLLIQEGVRYFIRRIDVEGCRAFHKDQIRELVHIKPGDPYREIRIERDIQRIQSYYGDRGYIRASARWPELQYDEKDPLVDLIFRVDEGNQKSLRDVVIGGNVTTKDKVIRREISLYPGDVIDTGEIRWSAQSLVGLRYFTDEKGAPKVDFQLRPTDDPYLEDLIIEVEEGGTGFLTFNIGVSTDTGLLGGVGINKDNFDIGDLPSSPWSFPAEFFRSECFHGGGQRLRLNANPGTRIASYNLSFTEPYLFDTQPYPVSLNLNAYRSYNFFSDYDQRRVGVSPILGKRWSRELFSSLGFRSEVVRISDIDDDAPADVFDVKGSTGIRALLGRVSYSDLDRPFSPTSGFTTFLNYEYFGGFLGSDVDMSKAVVGTTVFVPVYRTEAGPTHTFVLKGSFGWAEPHSSMDETPIFERFFAGGVSGYFPIRGFKWRGVGPHDRGDPIGGDAAWAVAMEYNIPLISEYNRALDLEEPRLKGVFFFDSGSVAKDIHERDLYHQIRTAYGAGLRLSLPVMGGVPIAIYYGIPVKKYDEDERRSFNINISKVF